MPNNLTEPVQFLPWLIGLTLAAKKVKRYFWAHLSMHFVYIEEFLCPPVYLEHPISQAFCDLASAKAANPRMRTVANAIASVLRIIVLPWFGSR